MSDISDVLTALANIAANAVYPNGDASPSVTNSDIIIYPGWPNSDNLDQDLLAGKTHVSVFPKVTERNTTRYSKKKSHVMKRPVTTLTLSISMSNAGHLQLEGGGNLLLEDGSSLLLDGNSLPVAEGGKLQLEAGGNLLLENGTNLLLESGVPGVGTTMIVTIGGAVSSPQNVMLRVNSKDYAYTVQVSDTLATIATALADLVAVDVTGTIAIGPAINIGISGRVQAARVGGFGTVAREIRRQERIVMLTVWAGNPSLRDQVAAAIDSALADIEFMTMPDGFGARLIYQDSPVIDALQKAALYRRDLNYRVEFATTVAEQVAAVIAPKLTISSGNNQVNITI
jgi:hypothetical protein